MRIVLVLAFLANGISYSQPKPSSQVRFNEAMQLIGSTPQGKPEDLKVMMDNDVAFEEKINILRAAQSGDKIFLGYYIHSDDHSTSLYNQELVAAARRGANVYILDDFLTNYKRLDMYNMLVKEGGGRIHVRFFNPPTRNIHKDAIYMTSNCFGGADCAEQKKEMLENILAEQAKEDAAKPITSKHLGKGTFFSRLFLAGLSAKSPEAMKIAIGTGGAMPDMPKDDSAKMSADEKAKAMEFGRLLFGAKVMGNTTDTIKLTLAFLLMGDQINSKYDAIDTALPIDIPHDSFGGKDWEDLTDFLHHKFTMLIKSKENGGGAIVQNGGRNLENSYHITETLRHLIEKYLFFDTDMKYSTKDKAFVNGLKKALAYFFGYNDMVVTLAQVNRELPVDYITELDLVKQAIAANEGMKKQKGVTFNQYEAKVENDFKALVAGRAQQRQEAAKAKMAANAKTYVDARAKIPEGLKGFMPSIVEKLDLTKDPNATVTYIENLPYFEELTATEQFYNDFANSTFGDVFGLKPVRPKKMRSYAPIPGEELKYNKNIHAAWIESFKRAADYAQTTKTKQTIYIHQGYSLLPSALVDAVGQMIRGDIPSEYLEIKLITNSFETTDLNPINILARHQFKAISEYMEQNRGRAGALGALRIFETLIPPDGKVVSLHSKAVITPVDVIIASANLDVRSYEMDTNNGTFLANVADFSRRVSSQIETKILGNEKLTREVSNYYRQNHNQILKEDEIIARKLIESKPKIAARLKDNLPSLTAALQGRMLTLYLATGMILDFENAEQIFGRASNISATIDDNSNGGGGGGTPSKQAMCKALFSDGKMTITKFSRADVLSRITNLKRQRGNKNVEMRLVDQILSTF